MLVLLGMIIISTFFNIFVKCIEIVDPEYPEFTNDEYNISKMISVTSSYFMEEDCTPLKIWLLTRHGTKYPSQTILDDIEIQLPTIQNNIKKLPSNYIDQLEKKNKEIIQNIKNWKNPMTSGSGKGLNNRGENAMILLGNRLKDKFYIFSEELQLDEIEIVSAKETRCIDSGQFLMKAFYKENFEDKIPIKINEDSILKLDKPKKTLRQIKTNEGYIEIYDYYINNNISSTISKIQNILFHKEVDSDRSYSKAINIDIVKTMYHACIHGFYYKHDNKKDKTKDISTQYSDAWCRLFDYDDFKMFEEANDLNYHYKNGHHFTETKTLGIPALRDIKQFLLNLEDKLKFKLFVGHTSNCLSIITSLGLFKDDPEIKIETISQMHNRKWRTSFIAPYGCNIMVVLYECFYETKKVSIYINEIPLEIIINDSYKCRKCPYDDVIKLLDKLVP